MKQVPKFNEVDDDILYVVVRNLYNKAAQEGACDLIPCYDCVLDSTEDFKEFMNNGN